MAGMQRGLLPAASAQLRNHSLPAALRQLQPANTQRARARPAVAQASPAVAAPERLAQSDMRSNSESNGASGQLLLRFGFPKGSAGGTGSWRPVQMWWRSASCSTARYANLFMSSCEFIERGGSAHNSMSNTPAEGRRRCTARSVCCAVGRRTLEVEAQRRLHAGALPGHVQPGAVGAGGAGRLSGAVRGGPGGHHHRQRAHGDHQAVSLHQAGHSRSYTPSAACGDWLYICRG